MISRATVTGLIDSLEQRGFARWLPYPSDRRMLLIELTDTGRQVANVFLRVVHQNHKLWLELLRESDQQRLTHDLHRLQQSLLERED